MHIPLIELAVRVANAIKQLPFMAYKLSDVLLMDVNNQLFFGHQETPAASIVIKKVQPLLP